MQKILLIIIVAGLILSTSCSKNLPDVGGTAAQQVANEWWCRIMVGNTDVGGGFKKLSTYNDAANKDSVWIDDLKNLYGFKSKVKFDYSNLTFATSNVSNLYYDPAHPANAPIAVSISNGKVLVKAGKSKSGNVTDSIYMEAKFSDDPTTTYIIAGTARTRFSEDEY